MKKSLLLSLFALSSVCVSATAPVAATLENVTPVDVKSDFVTYTDAEGWSEVVEGTIVENIIGPTFGFQSGSTYAVGVQKNFNTNTYRIIDPWRALYDAIGAEGYESPSIEINATDPTNAIVEPTDTGLQGQDDGAYSLLSFSYYYIAQGQDCPDEFKITVTENGGNTVITFPYHSTLISAAESGNNYYGCIEESTITFPTISDEQSGIEDVIVNNDAKVEYFNLQGIRVENPAQGQILIKRQGTTVNKVIIR